MPEVSSPWAYIAPPDLDVQFQITIRSVAVAPVKAKDAPRR